MAAARGIVQALQSRPAPAFETLPRVRTTDSSCPCDFITITAAMTGGEGMHQSRCTAALEVLHRYSRAAHALHANTAAGARRVLGGYSRGRVGLSVARSGSRGCAAALSRTQGKRRAGGSIAGYSGGTREHSAIGWDGDEDAGAVVWCRRALRSIPSQRGAAAMQTVLQRSRASLQPRRDRWKSR